jgi:hypothetical protein
VREEAREVELVHRAEDADRRDEDHPAPVRGDEAVGAPERFGPVLLPRDVEPAPERLRHLHRGEARPRRLARDRREREPREPGRVHEAGEVRVVEEERVLPVEMETAGERVRRRAVEDAAVRRERAGATGRAEADRLAPEGERVRPEAERRGPPVEPGQVVRVPAARQEDVRVGARELAQERAQEVLLGPLERRVAEADGDDPPVGRGEAPAVRSRERDREACHSQRRRSVVDRLRGLGRADRRAAADDRRERVEVVREVVELRRREVDVEERVPDEPAELVDRAGERPSRRVPDRDDLEDGPGTVVEDGRAEDDPADALDRRASGQPRPEVVEVAPRAGDIERRPVLDRGPPHAAGRALLRPQDDRAAVRTLRDVEQPRVRRGSAGHG